MTGNGQSRQRAHIGGMAEQTDILIVGGGLNGSLLALALAQGGLRVMLIDALPRVRRADPEFDGRAYALALASVRALQALGVWDRVAAHAQPITHIRASDGRPGQGASAFVLDLDHSEIEEGPMGHMIEDRFLRAALLDAIDATPGIAHCAGARVIAQDVCAQDVHVTLDTGEEPGGRLLVGCDGRESPTAARAGIRRTIRDYGQTALVCSVRHERPHGGTAQQFFMPSGPLAILPLRGNCSSIVWSEDRAQAQALMALDDADFLSALRPRFGSHLGDIVLKGGRYAYPLTLTLAERCTADRLALVGDAAHGVHPIAGQGLNLGVRDMAALAEVLIDAARRGEDIASPLVLDRYAQWRRFDTMMMAVGTDAFNRLFSNDNPLFRIVRDLGIAAVTAMPAARRACIREAAGLTGDLPRLLTGQRP